MEIYRHPHADHAVMNAHFAQSDIEVSGKAVATAAVPAAADTAIAILKAGGNAFDAAIAAALVESVWLPMKCGLAGDLVAMVRYPDGAFRALLSIGAGAEALGKGSRPAVTGPRSVGIPGAPAGYAALAKLGKLPLQQLAAPAINFARTGVSWLPIGVDLTCEAEAGLRRWNDFETPYLPSDRLPSRGEKISLPGLARALEIFVERGAELFWGEIGEALVRRVVSLGGFISVDDLRTMTAKWCDPVVLALPDGARIVSTPNPTHGTRLIRAFAHLVNTGDDDFEAVAAAIEEERAAGLDGDGTSVVTAADEYGNAVVVVHSNSFPQYGSCVTLPGYDLVLNNRPGRGFAMDGPPDGPNAPAPGRIPRTTLHAWGLEHGTHSLLGATPGGINQAPWNLQTIMSLLRRPDDLRRSVAAPRWGYDRRGHPVAEEGHRLAGQTGVTTVPALSLRSAEQVLASRPAGWAAAADPRTGAVARAMGSSWDVGSMII